MEAEHRDFIKRNFPAMAEKVFLFSKMIDKEFDIDDPVGGTIETYSSTAQELNSIIVSGFQKISDSKSQKNYNGQDNKIPE